MWYCWDHCREAAAVRTSVFLRRLGRKRRIRRDGNSWRPSWEIIFYIFFQLFNFFIQNDIDGSACVSDPDIGIYNLFQNGCRKNNKINEKLLHSLSGSHSENNATIHQEQSSLGPIRQTLPIRAPQRQAPKLHRRRCRRHLGRRRRLADNRILILLTVVTPPPSDHSSRTRPSPTSRTNPGGQPRRPS